jgi:hypothetical protein
MSNDAPPEGVYTSEGSDPNFWERLAELPSVEAEVSGTFDTSNGVGSPEWIAATMLEVQRIEAENSATIKRLQHERVGVQLPGVNIIQFVTLLDMVLGGLDSASRVAFELSVQQRIAEQLANVGSQAARTKLLAPGPAGARSMHGGATGLILPK